MSTPQLRSFESQSRRDSQRQRFSRINIEYDGLDMKEESLEAEKLQKSKSDEKLLPKSSDVSITTTFAGSLGPNDEEDQRYVRWGVVWHHQPLFMLFWALGGFALAISHHFYYSSLNGIIAGSDHRQQWAHSFGNLFAILVATTLRAACQAGYQQYFWLLVKRKSFSIAALDGLFALTSTPWGFSGLHLWKDAPIAIIFALICWVVTLAGLVTPGTLTVTSGVAKHIEEASVPILDWDGGYWVDGGIPYGITPSETAESIASQSAGVAEVLQFQTLWPNSSYSLDVQGPYLKCELANSTQLPTSQYIQQLLTQLDPPVYTGYTLPPLNISSDSLSSFAKNSSAEGNILMAFDPYLGFDGWSYTIYDTSDAGDFDAWNNWPLPLPPSFNESLGYFGQYTAFGVNETCLWSQPDHCHMIPRQLWLLTANETTVCTLGNGTRHVQFNFNDNVQTVSYGELQDFSPIFVPFFGYMLDENSPSMSIYQSVTTLLSGNISMDLSSDPEAFYDSRIYLTGLDACDDVTNNMWTQLFPSDNFGKPGYLCRNRTLARAVEDLMTNVTISMMTSANLSIPDGATVAATITETHNIYQYTPTNLISSYSIAIFFTIINLLAGLYAFRSNGVAHSSSFSAIVATTRNQDIGVLMEGESLGALPRNPRIRDSRLIFGTFEDKGRRRAGFGFAGEIRDLRIGETCI